MQTNKDDYVYITISMPLRVKSYDNILIDRVLKNKDTLQFYITDDGNESICDHVLETKYGRKISLFYNITTYKERLLKICGSTPVNLIELVVEDFIGDQKCMEMMLELIKS